MLLNKKNIYSLFYIFIITHLFLWTLVPSLTNNNLPLDTIEHLAWGSNLDWSFKLSKFMCIDNICIGY